MNTLKGGSLLVLTVMTLSLLSNSRTRAQTVEAKLDEYMNALVKLERFNGSVLLAQGGKVLFSRSYGLASFEDEVSNTPQTKFRLASITKSFTAMAVMMLQERGKLNVQDPVCKYLANCSEAWDKVTIHHLLSHTSGIPDYASSPTFMNTIASRSAIADLVGQFKDRQLEFMPGERFAYSNSNYILLGQIIERTSGRPFAAFVQENIFTPLQMTNSGYDDNRTILKRRAIGYRQQGGALVNALYMDMSNAYAAGALYSTVEDLLLWERALDAEKLVAKKSLEAVFQPGKGGAGYGWFINRVGSDRLLITQAGLNAGFTGQFFRYPEEKICIILLSNFEHAAPYLSQTGSDLAAILFGEKYELSRQFVAVKVDPKTYDDYVGEYEFGPNRMVTVSREGDKLMAQRTGGPKDELLPASETEFFLNVAGVRIIFIKDGAGKVAQMKLQANGQEFMGRKLR